MVNTSQLQSNATFLQNVDVSSGYQQYLVIFVALLGLAENGTVTVMLWTKRHLRQNAHTFFVLCLSLSDLLFAIYLMLQWIIMVFDVASYQVCVISYIFVCFIHALGHTITLCIAIERYMCVNSKGLYTTVFTDRRKYLVLICSIIINAIIFSVILTVFPLKKVSTCRFEISYSDKAVTASAVGILMCLKILIIVFYLSTLFSLHTISKRVTDQLPYTNNFEMEVPQSTTNPVDRPFESSSTENEEIDTHFSKSCHTKNKDLSSASCSKGTQTRPSLTGFPDHLLPNAPNDANIIGSHNSDTRTTTLLASKLGASRNVIGRSMWTVSLVVLCFVVFLVPDAIARLLLLFNDSFLGVVRITEILVCTLPLVNPFLYVWRFPKLRQEFKLCQSQSGRMA